MAIKRLKKAMRRVYTDLHVPNGKPFLAHTRRFGVYSWQAVLAIFGRIEASGKWP